MLIFDRFELTRLFILIKRMDCVFVHRRAKNKSGPNFMLRICLYFYYVDVSRAFDSVENSQSSLTLLGQEYNPYIVALLSYWYSYGSYRIKLSDRNLSSPLRL